MVLENSTRFTEFILLGFPAIMELQILLFVILLVAYFSTLLENFVIIALIRTNHLLHKPMYLFLSNLSFLGVWYILVIVPKLLLNFLGKKRIISFMGCMTQLFFFSSFMCTECVLLAVMAYDHYIAVCHPLQYSAVMTHHLCLYLVALSWFSGFSISLIKVSFISCQTFCGSRVINHVFCDISPVLNLSCTDLSLAELVDFLLGLIILLVPLSVTACSYLYIVTAILSISTAQSRKKAFSTCASHLTVVVIFFSATLFMYTQPKKIHPYNLNKLVSIVYTIVPPVVNPFIYCLRNQEVKGALRKAFF